MRLGRLIFLIVQIMLFMHQIQNDTGPVLAALQICRRCEIAWRFQQTSQHRGLGRGHIGGRLVEIALAGGLEATGTGPQIGPVHVDVENIVLGIFGLQREGEGNLFHLAPDAADPAIGLELGLILPADRVKGVTQAQQLGNLLGDGRTAIAFQRATTFGEVDLDGPGNAARADAEMAIEAAVLGGDHRFAQDRRDLVAGDGPKGFPRHAKTRPSRSSIVTEPRARASNSSSGSGRPL